VSSYWVEELFLHCFLLQYFVLTDALLRNVGLVLVFY
jgi:hypothetical protein